eukprot:gnl/MRDRNA2_/MRDRNA2_101933_c0_seq1.p1 gnl/MRDRNA2_/MRDRNA2_101933_c0~~gnl/MRDRNA2_/MRDRNA2_101933_c0_seq1.p1  ORF type:complete len:677 (-),score=186.30 gnl/MRDRNA2_/MRDRNA2_101933_c0_seq1:100-2130(-)
MAPRLAVGFFVGFAAAQSAVPSEDGASPSGHLDELFLTEGPIAKQEEPAEKSISSLSEPSSTLQSFSDVANKVSDRSITNPDVNMSKSLDSTHEASPRQPAKDVNQALDEEKAAIKLKAKRHKNPKTGEEDESDRDEGNNGGGTNEAEETDGSGTNDAEETNTEVEKGGDVGGGDREATIAPLRQEQVKIADLTTKLKDLIQVAHDTGNDVIQSAQKYKAARDKMEPLRKTLNTKILGYMEKVDAYHEKTKNEILKHGDFMKGSKAAESLPQITETEDSAEGLPTKDEDGDNGSVLQKAGYGNHDLEDLEGAVEEERRKADEAEKAKLLHEDPLDQLLNEPQESIRDYSHTTAFGTTLLQLTSDSRASSDANVKNDASSSNGRPRKEIQGLDEFSVVAAPPRSNLGFLAQDPPQNKNPGNEPTKGKLSRQHHSRSKHASHIRVAAKPHSVIQKHNKKAKAGTSEAEEDEQNTNGETDEPPDDGEKEEETQDTSTTNGAQDNNNFQYTIAALQEKFSPAVADSKRAAEELGKAAKAAVDSAEEFSNTAKEIIPLRNSMVKEVGSTQVKLQDFVASVSGIVKRNTDNSAFAREVESRQNKANGGSSLSQNHDRGHLTDINSPGHNAQLLGAHSKWNPKDIPKSLTSIDWEAMERMSKKSQWQQEQEDQWTQEALKHMH